MTKKVKIITGVSIVSILAIGLIIAVAVTGQQNNKFTFTIDNKTVKFIDKIGGGVVWESKDTKILPDGIFKQRSISITGRVDLKYTPSSTSNATLDKPAKFNFNSKVEITGSLGAAGGNIFVQSDKDKKLFIGFVITSIVNEKTVSLSCGTKDGDELKGYQSSLTTYSLVLKY